MCSNSTHQSTVKPALCMCLYHFLCMLSCYSLQIIHFQLVSLCVKLDVNDMILCHWKTLGICQRLQHLFTVYLTNFILADKVVLNCCTHLWRCNVEEPSFNPYKSSTVVRTHFSAKVDSQALEPPEPKVGLSIGIVHFTSKVSLDCGGDLPCKWQPETQTYSVLYSTS